MALNIRGIKQSSIVVNALTIGKLTPLVLFILIGLPHVSLGALRPDIPLTWDAVSGHRADADLCVRRLRSDSGAGRRSARSARRPCRSR